MAIPSRAPARNPELADLAALRGLRIPPHIADVSLPLAVAVFRFTSPVANLAVVLFICHVYGIEPTPAQFIANYSDPLTARFSGTSGGNPDLEEETATTWTVGGVIQPGNEVMEIVPIGERVLVEPVFRAPGGGAILFTASGLGLHGRPLIAMYAAAKHAIVGRMRSLALERLFSTPARARPAPARPAPALDRRARRRRHPRSRIVCGRPSWRRAGP